MIKNRTQKGFSIVEMILYVTILAFMLVVIFNILATINKASRKIKSTRELQSSASLGLERIVREVRQASSVNNASSTLGTSPGDLSLNSTDTGGNSESVEFFLSNKILHVKINGVDQGALTKSDVSVTNLIFTSITATSSKAVRTQLTLESGTSTAYKTANFYTTTVMRGSI